MQICECEEVEKRMDNKLIEALKGWKGDTKEEDLDAKWKTAQRKNRL